MPHKLGKKSSVETRILRTSTCYYTTTVVRLSVWGKNSEEREGREGDSL